MIINGIDFEVVSNGSMAHITWGELEKKMGRDVFKEFEKFIFGQTCFETGAFLGDVEKFYQEPEERYFD